MRRSRLLQKAKGKARGTGKGKSSSGGDEYTVTPSIVAPGEEFTISIEITNSGGTEINEIHLSCSQPLNLGDVYGSLTLVGANGEVSIRRSL